MRTRFVCLSNSFKEGGRCIAGIELDSNNNPVFVNGHRKWLRPVCRTPYGEVPTHLVDHFKKMDLVEIDITGQPDEINYQSENVYFIENSISIVGNFPQNRLHDLCDDRNTLFGNRGKAITDKEIINLTYSLMLIHTDLFEVISKLYNDNPHNPQTRLNFAFRGNMYDFPVTDPVFLYQYRSDSNYLQNCKSLYLCLSLTVPWKDWYYKLVAGVIPVM